MENNTKTDEKKLTARERREKTILELKAKQKKLEEMLKEDIAKEEKKNFLPLGREIYQLCIDKGIDISNPQNLRIRAEGWCEFGMVASKFLRTASLQGKELLIKAIAENCTKESTQSLLKSLGYTKAE